VPQDFTQAVEWYRKGAAGSDPWAEKALGEAYELGRGAPQDYAQAAAWYRKSADHGNSRAQFFLGRLYENGHGVAQDDQLAYFWFSVALAAPSLGSHRQEAIDSQAAVRAKLSKTQIEKADLLVKEWKPRPATKGAS